MNNQRPYDMELDLKLIDYFNGLRAKHLPINGKMFHVKAIELKQNEGFMASQGWLMRFLNRNNIV